MIIKKIDALNFIHFQVTCNDILYNKNQIIPTNERNNFNIKSYVGFILSNGNILSLDYKSILFLEKNNLINKLVNLH